MIPITQTKKKLANKFATPVKVNTTDENEVE